MSADDVLPVTRDGRVAVATLNRPGKANALNQQLIDALDDLATRIETNAGAGGPAGAIGALVITGAGGNAFSAGADVAELDGISEQRARRQMRRGQRVFDRIEALPVVVIAAVNGYALGGGLELAMAADIRIAAPGARLGQPEIMLGNIPGWGGTQRLARLVGRGRATELILTGDLLDARRGYELGLVNHVADDALAASIELGRRVADRSATAVAAAKRAIAIGLDGGIRAGLLAEADGVATCCGTEEQRMAVRDFLQRKTTIT